MAGDHRAPGRRRLRYDKAAALLVATGVTGFALVSGIGEVSTGDGGGDVSVASSSRARSATDVDVTPTTKPVDQKAAGTAAETADETALPGRSGSGRRVVFDIDAQRVWLVDKSNQVRRTYLVSGSVTDNLKPGHYAVYSRSRNAVGIDDSGTMEYFVRFTRGENAAIGFHDIPINDGQKVQSVAQLGTPRSHGCIRQNLPDAIKMWDFADLGTKVDVVA